MMNYIMHYFQHDSWQQNSIGRIFIVFFIVLFLLYSKSALATQCLYVSSYHVGYEWNDGIERGLERSLKGKCELDKFYMDTKRNKDKLFAEEKALVAKQHIDKTRPDIIIACDDNASKYLIKPYYKDKATPVVFCGVNWSVEEYGYPYTNATGIIEVVPMRPLIKAIQETVKPLTNGVYLSSDVYTEHKDFERYRKLFKNHNISLRGIFVKTLTDWKSALKKSQTADFILLGNNGGINDWDRKDAENFSLDNAHIFTVTNYDWMMPYAMFAMTKIPEEQGEWAGQVALTIINGISPEKIPIVVNRRWNILINSDLIDKARVILPAHLLQKATKIEN